MRLICPHCMSGVTVPDDAAGKEATCPNCGKSFPTPARYSAQVAPDASGAVAGPIDPVRTSPHPEPPPVPAAPAPHAPPAPPGYVPPVPPLQPSGFLPPSAPAEVPAVAGYTKARGITVSPKVVAWLPATLLTLTLVFTCFPWVGSYAGSTAVYSQRPWNAQFGWVSRDYALEKALPIPNEWLNKMSSDWALMIPYLLLLLSATALAWADRGFHALDPRNVPPLAKVWPHRHTVLFVLAAFVLFLSLVQVSRGFGMERAIRKTVGEQFAAAREKATTAGDEASLARLEKYEMDVAYRAYNIEHTTWLYLALLCNFLAVVALVVWFFLDRRGDKPPPKILLHY